MNCQHTVARLYLRIMHFPKIVACCAAIILGLPPAARAADFTWTTHANIPYAELQRGNRDASPNLVSLDVYVPEGLAPGEKLPVVIMIHGGAWTEGDKANARVVAQKIPFFLSNGFIFASANYELSPAIKHPVHVQDVAKAVAFLHENADDYHIDPENITLMGHSSGAQTVALAAVDGRYLQQAGKSTRILSRVILLDGIYDLPYRLRTDDHQNKKAIHAAFGRNPLVLMSASPALIVKKSPRTYTPPILNFFSDVPSKVASDLEFIKNLRKNNIPAGGIICWKYTHDDVDWYVGLEGSEMNQPILDFLAGADPQTLDGQIVKTPGPAIPQIAIRILPSPCVTEGAHRSNTRSPYRRQVPTGRKVRRET